MPERSVAETIANHGPDKVKLIYFERRVLRLGILSLMKQHRVRFPELMNILKAGRHFYITEKPQ